MDWEAKQRALNAIIDDLVLLSQQLDGRNRMLLAGTTDDLKRFAAELEPLVPRPVQEQHRVQDLPDWLKNFNFSSDEAF